MKYIFFDIETTGLDRFSDRIICYCILDEEDKLYVDTVKTSRVDNKAEEEILLSLHKNLEHLLRFPQIRVFTFNGEYFDLPFVKCRALHHFFCGSGLDEFAKLYEMINVLQSKNIDYMRLIEADFLAPYWDRKNTWSLDKLAKFVGVDHRSELDGSKVNQLLVEGKIKQIEEHCIDDVKALKSIHKNLYPFLRKHMQSG